ncbi:MAG: phenylalanine--tRNA ligase subunit beta [Planctomycetaceae bacterium]|nr:phenylalanine--tRNA ligase subunit beta [Planctomycetaceae bacterium]
MIVSWNWLKEYVRLDMPVDALTERLMMAGLNLEKVADVQGDMAIDLEVTSNRPDCLCHLGVAREVGVLFDREYKLPPAEPAEKGPPVASVASVDNQCPDLCLQYTARVIQGVKVGPSPSWMQRRLATLGIRPINNVVDITNYVLMECGQPLHAFDFDKLDGRKIIVRRGEQGEKLTAIDQRQYDVTSQMCVIADATRPVAIAGVMGGYETEIGPQTTRVLIEVAEFTPRSVRATARKLHLFSDSSYRFERGIDRENLDWAGRRCAQLILELAGGELCQGAVRAGSAPASKPAPVVLRLSQLPRILGIDIPQPEVERILLKLGMQPAPGAAAGTCRFIVPHWRRDLGREIDLIEEVARIHGYDKIPENVPVPLEVSQTTRFDRLCQRLSEALIAAGFFEAVTLSFISDAELDLFRPWTNAAPLRVEHTSRQRENILRQSLIPSLLLCRRQNERHRNLNAQLFEMARVYLAGEPERPEAQPRLLGFVSGKSFAEIKGIVELLVDSVNHAARVTAKPAALAACLPGRACELLLDGKRLGWLGELSDDVRKQLDLQDPVTVAEIDLGVLEAVAEFEPTYQPVPEYPAIERDLNFLLDEPVTWQELEATVRGAAGSLLESVAFESQYRGQHIPANKKSYVARLHFRAPDRTLTDAEVDAAQKKVVAACGEKLSATLR